MIQQYCDKATVVIAQFGCDSTHVRERAREHADDCGATLVHFPEYRYDNTETAYAAAAYEGGTVAETLKANYGVRILDGTEHHEAYDAIVSQI